MSKRMPDFLTKYTKAVNRKKQWLRRKIRSNNRKPRSHPARDY